MATAMSSQNENVYANNLHIISISLSATALCGVVVFGVVFVAYLCCKRREGSKGEWTHDEPESTVVQTSTRPTCCEASMNTDISTSDGIQNLKMPRPPRHPEDGHIEVSSFDGYSPHEKQGEGNENEAGRHSQSRHGHSNRDLELRLAYRPQQTELDVAHQQVKKASSWSPDRGKSIRPKEVVYRVLEQSDHKADLTRKTSACASHHHNEMTVPACPSVLPYVPDRVSSTSSIGNDAYELIDDQNNDVILKLMDSRYDHVNEKVRESSKAAMFQRKSNTLMSSYERGHQQKLDAHDPFYDLMDTGEDQELIGVYGNSGISFASCHAHPKPNRNASVSNENQYNHLGDAVGNTPISIRRTACTFPRLMRDIATNPSRTSPMYGKHCYPEPATDDGVGRSGGFRESKDQFSVYENPHKDRQKFEEMSRECIYGNTIASDDNDTSESEDSSCDYENTHGMFGRSEGNMDDGHGPESNGGTSQECIYDDTVSEKRNTLRMKGSTDTSTKPTTEQKKQRPEALYDNLTDVPKSKEDTSNDCIYEDTVTTRGNTRCMKGSGDPSSIHVNPPEQGKPCPELLYDSVPGDPKSKEKTLNEQIYDNTMVEEENTERVKGSGDPSSSYVSAYNQDKPRRPELLYDNLMDGPTSDEESSSECIYDDTTTGKPTNDIQESGNPSQFNEHPFTHGETCPEALYDNLVDDNADDLRANGNESKPANDPLSFYENFDGRTSSQEEDKSRSMKREKGKERKKEKEEKVQDYKEADGFRANGEEFSPANDPCSFYANFDSRKSSHNMAGYENKDAERYLKEEEKVQDVGEDNIDRVPMHLRHVYANLQHKRELLRQSLGIFPTGIAHPPPPPES